MARRLAMCVGALIGLMFVAAAWAQMPGPSTLYDFSSAQDYLLPYGNPCGLGQVRFAHPFVTKLDGQNNQVWVYYFCTDEREIFRQYRQPVYGQ